MDVQMVTRELLNFIPPRARMCIATTWISVRMSSPAPSKRFKPPYPTFSGYQSRWARFPSQRGALQRNSIAADPVAAKIARRSAAPRRNSWLCLHQGAILPSSSVTSDPIARSCGSRRPQPGDERQKLLEHLPRHCHLGHLEGGVAAVAHDLGTDLDQLLAQAGQRPRLRRLRHRQRPHEIAEIVGQRVELEADGVGGEGSARQAGPLDRALALFDPLLCGAAVVIEGDEALHRPRQVGDDKADARIKLTRMPLDPRLREGRHLATTRRGFVHEPAW